MHFYTDKNGNKMKMATFTMATAKVQDDILENAGKLSNAALYEKMFNFAKEALGNSLVCSECNGTGIDDIDLTMLSYCYTSIVLIYSGQKQLAHPND